MLMVVFLLLHQILSSVINADQLLFTKYEARKCVVDRLTTTSHNYSTSLIECCALCFNNNKCIAFYYHFNSMICRFIEKDFDTSILLLEQADGCDQLVSIFVTNIDDNFSNRLTKCPSQYNRHFENIPKSFYKFVFEKTDWIKARDDCSKDGYKLVQISSDEEYNVLSGWKFFVGLRQINKLDEPAGNWLWIGSEETLYKDIWEGNNPNNVGNREYVAVMIGESNGLNDLPINSVRNYFCECLVA